jgi:hypothetical protein
VWGGVCGLVGLLWCGWLGGFFLGCGLLCGLYFYIILCSWSRENFWLVGGVGLVDIYGYVFIVKGYKYDN